MYGINFLKRIETEKRRQRNEITTVLILSIYSENAFRMVHCLVYSHELSQEKEQQQK